MQHDRNLLRPIQRRSIYALTILMFTSGVLWFGLDRYGQIEGEFGPSKHPWQRPALVTHGVFATAYLLALGGVLTRHVRRGWALRSQRAQASALLVIQAILVLTAPALYYLSHEELRSVISNMHMLAGTLLGIALPAHLWLGRSYLRGNQPNQAPNRSA